jgi:hypothetical protein
MEKFLKVMYTITLIACSVLIGNYLYEGNYDRALLFGLVGSQLILYKSILNDK